MKKIINFFIEKKNLLKSNIKINYIKDRPGHDFKYSLNSNKIKNTLNWKCRHDFDEGLEKTILWYIDKFNTKYFKNKNFIKRQGLGK